MGMFEGNYSRGEHADDVLFVVYEGNDFRDFKPLSSHYVRPRIFNQDRGGSSVQSFD
jgi:hypothetical protein